MQNVFVFCQESQIVSTKTVTAKEKGKTSFFKHGYNTFYSQFTIIYNVVSAVTKFPAFK